MTDIAAGGETHDGCERQQREHRMQRNPYDPNKSPMKWASWEMARNKKAYLERFPEERGQRPYQTSGFHRDIGQSRPVDIRVNIARGKTGKTKTRSIKW